MEIVVKRIAKKPTYTIGKLYINNKYFCDTIEDKDRGLTQYMSEEDIKRKKVYGETAIPIGTYKIELTYSSKFANRQWAKKYKGRVPQLLNVKGFLGIRIHPLNTAADSLGCLGVGLNTEVGKVTQSTKYYYKLLDEHLIPAFNKKEVITIAIA